MKNALNTGNEIKYFKWCKKFSDVWYILCFRYHSSHYFLLLFLYFILFNTKSGFFSLFSPIISMYFLFCLIHKAGSSHYFLLLFLYFYFVQYTERVLLTIFSYYFYIFILFNTQSGFFSLFSSIIFK